MTLHFECTILSIYYFLSGAQINVHTLLFAVMNLAFSMHYAYSFSADMNVCGCAASSQQNPKAPLNLD